MRGNLFYKEEMVFFCSLVPNWWIFALRGLVSTIFGCLMVFMPASTLLSITSLFGAFAITDAIFFIMYAINQAYKGRQWGGLILSGIMSLIVGVIVLVTPQIASISILIFLWVMMLCIRSVAIGTFEAAAGMGLLKEIEGEWLLAFHGFCYLTLGLGGFILYWFKPLESLLTLCLAIGAYFIASGLILLFLSFKLYKKKGVLTFKV